MLILAPEHLEQMPETDVLDWPPALPLPREGSDCTLQRCGAIPAGRYRILKTWPPLSARYRPATPPPSNPPGETGTPPAGESQVAVLALIAPLPAASSGSCGDAGTGEGA